MTNKSEISILPFQQLGGLAGQSEGHCIFVDCDGYHMGVGSILPLSDGKYLLNVTIMAEMKVPRFKTCNFADFYDSMEAAADAARGFLESQRDEER